jgi:hypothetical protein
VVKGRPLLALLRRIRRRVRFLAALEGGVSGGAIAAAALAAAVVIIRWRGGSPAPAGRALAGGLISAGVLVGVLARAAARISLSRCARIADAALDGQERVLSAFCLDRGSPSPLVAALIADAERHAAHLLPGRAVPLRRPPGLPALLGAVAALCGALLFPISSRAARTPPRSPSGSEPLPLPPGALEGERDEARRASEAAARLADRRLAALAADFDRALRGLSSGRLTEGAALDLLRALQTQAAEAASAAEQGGRATAAAAGALAEKPETRAAGKALADDAGERASEALGASAAAHPSETGQALAAAARGVAQSLADTNGGSAETKTGPRRLARNGAAADSGAIPPQTGSAESDARRLEQLRRDLDQAGAACRDGDSSCRARAEDGARDLARLGRQAAAADSLRRLERAAEQTRARVSRGELRDGDALAAGSFSHAAQGRGDDRDRDQASRRGDVLAEKNGRESSSGAASVSARSGSAAGSEDASGAALAERAAALSASESSGAQPGDGTGQGIGRQPGGAPLGHEDDRAGGGGREIEAQLANGRGPSRSEVIGAAAGQGFVDPGYARVFTDYAAAVEDALGATAVPEGKRYVVRRYFDLIRPRGAR